MSDYELIGILDRFDSNIDRYKDLAKQRIEANILTVDNTISLLESKATLIVALQTDQTNNLIQYIYIKVVSYTLSDVRHHSPQLLATLAAIWGFIVAVYNGVKWVIDFFYIKELLQIAQILSIIWPAFRDKMNKVYTKISEFSEQIGWGADGIIHLIQATQSGLNVVAGLTGKDWRWLNIRWADKAVDTLTTISELSTSIASNPGAILDLIFVGEGWDAYRETSVFMEKLTGTIDIITEKADDAIKGIGSVIGELTSIQDNMPEAVRKNIPATIWIGLYKADNFINDIILPGLSKLRGLIESLSSRLVISEGNLSSLAKRLANPGSLLSEVDLLSELDKQYQLGLIDDVASRKLASETDSEFLGMADDMKGLTLIDNAMRAPTPSPGFMTLETPEKQALSGIVAEPLETWFINGYSDSL